jgi:hypothetical protein
MSPSTRTTVYFDPKALRALKVRAALTDRSISELVNEAVLLALREEEIDAQAVKERAGGTYRAFEEVVKDLKRDGRL